MDDGFIQLVVNTITTNLKEDKSWLAVNLLNDEDIVESLGNYSAMDFPCFMLEFADSLYSEIKDYYSDWHEQGLNVYNNFVAKYNDYVCICQKLSQISAFTVLRDIHDELCTIRQEIIDCIDDPSDPLYKQGISYNDLPF